MKAFLSSWTFLIVIQLLPIKTLAQESYKVWNDEKIYDKTVTAVNAIYHWEFEDAQNKITEIKAVVPNDHPLPYFLEAMYLFWERAPIGYDSPEAKKHFELLLKTAELSKKRLDEDEEDIEGLFFRLVAQSIIMRGYAEQHETMKSAGYASEVYGLIRKAMSRKEEEKEFYFVAGMYNYYRDAYPSKYPAYKPFLMFFPKGDKELGLDQIKKSARDNVFTRCEAQLYLVYIYLYYEEDYETALSYAKNLIEEYPKNRFFHAIYLGILERGNLLNQGVDVITEMDQNAKDPFYQTTAKVFNGIYGAKYKGETEEAYTCYMQVEKELEKLGTRGTFLHAYVYGNLYKYYSDHGDKSKAKHYYKLAKAHDYFHYLKRIK
ncbi:hypothetical protein [Sediminitomix flava]|uniref:Tetratricopeptide repeat protein n=1 Tax=Sediminitomix flava TaxID=379075 RepID=A0A315Z0G3_SEDFL|nr:hypothetical protein [Sediminitomix flava]PWJ36118.1 hypothetical protein BC781_109134 [Sediminitomix flava]